MQNPNPKKAILCIDDEAIISLSLKSEFRNHYKDRFFLETGHSAEEGLEILKELSEDSITVLAILSDWQMPGMKGDEFYEIVRENYPDIHFIFITGQKDFLSAPKSSPKNVTIFEKPWNSRKLFQIIESLDQDPSTPLKP